MQILTSNSHSTAFDTFIDSPLISIQANTFFSYNEAQSEQESGDYLPGESTFPDPLETPSLQGVFPFEYSNNRYQLCSNRALPPPSLGEDPDFVKFPEPDPLHDFTNPEVTGRIIRFLTKNTFPYSQRISLKIRGKEIVQFVSHGNGAGILSLPNGLQFFFARGFQTFMPFPSCLLIHSDLVGLDSQPGKVFVDQGASVTVWNGISPNNNFPSPISMEENGVNSSPSVFPEINLGTLSVGDFADSFGNWQTDGLNQIFESLNIQLNPLIGSIEINSPALRTKDGSYGLFSMPIPTELFESAPQNWQQLSSNETSISESMERVLLPPMFSSAFQIESAWSHAPLYLDAEGNSLRCFPSPNPSAYVQLPSIFEVNTQSMEECLLSMPIDCLQLSLTETSTTTSNDSGESAWSTILPINHTLRPKKRSPNCSVQKLPPRIQVNVPIKGRRPKSKSQATYTRSQVSSSTRPFFCEYCYLGYKKPHELSRHLKSCALNPKPKTLFSCFWCRKTMTRSDNMRKHEKRCRKRLS